MEVWVYVVIIIIIISILGVGTHFYLKMPLENKFVVFFDEPLFSYNTKGWIAWTPDFEGRLINLPGNKEFTGYKNQNKT